MVYFAAAILLLFVQMPHQQWSNMKLLAFIIPYFGVLPKEMEYFLLTTNYNPDYTWIIITDDCTQYDYPSNVIVIRKNFSEIQSQIQKKFDFPIALNHPKKLCDFKPAYGYIFDEELKEFEYWGYCDLDQYFGDLSHWLTKSYLRQYDRVFALGHMTIYRNISRINRLFMETDLRDNISLRSYKDVFSNEKNLSFDEIPESRVNINTIATQQQIRQSFDWFAADILPFRSNFIESFCDVRNMQWSSSPPKTSLIVFWENGRIYLLERKADGFQKREVLYVHIQKRKLRMKKSASGVNAFLIMPNRIIPITTEKLTQTVNGLFRKNKYRKMLHVDESSSRLIAAKNIVIHKFKLY